MKKILAMLLAVMMLLSVASVAMADETTPTTPTYTDQETVTIKKVYKLTNDGTTSPAETFTLEQVGNGEVKDGDATSAPALGTITGAKFDEGAATVDGTTGNITVALPQYTHVGVYEYTLKEVAGTTAGVTYYGDNITLKVTVINDTTSGKLRIAAVHAESANNALEEGKTKKDNFPNTYSAGTLKVSKTVTGNLGDKTKKFQFKVDFTAPNGKTWTPAITGQGFTTATTTEGATISYTFELANDESVTFGNLPEGVTYKVTETAVDGYDTYVGTTDNKTNVATGKMEKTNVDVKYINNKGGELDMGVMLDSMPYVLVLAVVGAAVIALIAKKRRVED